MKSFAENDQRSPDTSNKRSVLVTLFCIAVVAIWTLHLLKPLFDPDFYWHLKTGDWIWDAKALPSSDPFTVSPQPADSNAARFILTSYWLFQLLLSAMYKIGGFGGIYFFRFILAAVFIAVLYRFSTTRNVAVVVVASAGITQILAQHFPERPQFASFVCTALLLSTLFSWLRKNNGFLPLLIPLGLTMLLWANMHGGFLLGQMLLVAILLAEALKFLDPRLSPLTGRQFSILALSIAGAILLSFINPNHLHGLQMMRPFAEANNVTFQSVLEFSNMYEYYLLVGGPEPVLAACTYLLVLLLLIRSRERTNITWVVLLVLLGYMGISHVRYYPLFLVCATLFAIHEVDTRAFGRMSRVVAIVFSLCVLTLSLSLTPRNLRLLATYGAVPAAYYPVKACDVIKANGIRGNIFTQMNWGGYVIWRLAPYQKVFFDGRQLDPVRAREYFTYSDNWKPLYDKYDIQVLIMPIYNEQFKPFPQTEALRTDADWRLIASGNNGAVFVRAQYEKYKGPP